MSRRWVFSRERHRAHHNPENACFPNYEHEEAGSGRGPEMSGEPVDGIQDPHLDNGEAELRTQKAEPEMGVSISSCY